ncbi:response regulator [Maribellus comscasis]|uniref:histidine kinase n=1 Tax=Maribellus comscasis TaxID=2681766 RepID=A0A6I6K2P7_9BACT|nr:response regulator [Maribellus comscasis]QGY46712.1 response regulator [Maribellus comscasis]
MKISLKFEYKITLAYLLIGGLWILFSDKILHTFAKDAAYLTQLQTLKGWFYVILTGVLFYILLKRHLERLRKAEQEAKESDRLKTSFLQNISHEIRTPMNGIIGFASLLEFDDLPENQKKEYIKIITKSSKQLLSIVNDVLDISMIQSGNIKVNDEIVNINELLEDIYTVFSPRIPSKVKFILTKGLDNKSVFVLTDRSKLRQILINLVSNSIKFTEKGYIEFGYYIKNKKLKFYVEDTGIGIKSELHEKIFERFRKADNNLMRLYDGIGLGLAICKGNIDLLRGEIGLDSKEGVGSRFYFTIPYKTRNRAVELNSLESDFVANPKNESLILVVEDDKSNLRYVMEILRRAQINYAVAKNGKEAVEICKTEKNIFMVLMDLKMPVMDGYQATKKIKDIRSDLPVIAQTAFAFEEEKQKVLESGFDDYLSKPFNRKELLKIIKEYQQFN